MLGRVSSATAEEREGSVAAAVREPGERVAGVAGGGGVEEVRGVLDPAAAVLRLPSVPVAAELRQRGSEGRRCKGV